MNDTIDRQAAISAICNACGKIDCDKMDKCEKLQLPPANCSEFPNNSDTISRQAAINALMEIMDRPNHAEFLYTDEICKTLNGLPSAQPEYEELTPEEAASEIASGSIMSASYWFDLMIRLKQMGYAICRKVSEQHEST